MHLEYRILRDLHGQTHEIPLCYAVLPLHTSKILPETSVSLQRWLIGQDSGIEQQGTLNHHWMSKEEWEPVIGLRLLLEMFVVRFWSLHLRLQLPA